MNLGFCPITVAEIWGSFYALNMAWKKGFGRVILELDSFVVVELIHGEGDSKHPLCLGDSSS